MSSSVTGNPFNFAKDCPPSGSVSGFAVVHDVYLGRDRFEFTDEAQERYYEDQRIQSRRAALGGAGGSISHAGIGFSSSASSSRVAPSVSSSIRGVGNQRRQSRSRSRSRSPRKRSAGEFMQQFQSGQSWLMLPC